MKESEVEIVRTYYEGRRKYYICRCLKCGSEKRVRSDVLGKYKCSNCSLRDDAIPMVGKKFGKLTVKEFVGHKNGRPMWLCVCECGKEVICNGYNIRRGKESCGCARKGKVAYIKHGFRNTRVYDIWCGIKKRCYNPDFVGYSDYGGRGIKMCEEWRDSPASFCEWALKNGYDDSLTIERINYNGDYEPNNCTWIPKEEQSLNQRSNIVFYCNSERYTLSEIAKRHKIKYDTIYQHYHRKKEIKSYLLKHGITEQYEQNQG